MLLAFRVVETEMVRSMHSASWGADTTHGSGTISPYGWGGREMQQSGDAAEEPELDATSIEKSLYRAQPTVVSGPATSSPRRGQRVVLRRPED